MSVTAIGNKISRAWNWQKGLRRIKQGLKLSHSQNLNTGYLTA